MQPQAGTGTGTGTESSVEASGVIPLWLVLDGAGGMNNVEETRKRAGLAGVR